MDHQKQEKQIEEALKELKISHFDVTLEYYIEGLDKCIKNTRATYGDYIENLIKLFFEENKLFKLYNHNDGSKIEFNNVSVFKYDDIFNLKAQRKLKKSSLILPENDSNPAMDLYYFDKQEDYDTLYCCQVTIQKGSILDKFEKRTVDSFYNQVNIWKEFLMTPGSGKELNFHLVFITTTANCRMLLEEKRDFIRNQQLFRHITFVNLTSFSRIFKYGRQAELYNKFLSKLKIDNILCHLCQEECRSTMYEQHVITMHAHPSLEEHVDVEGGGENSS